MKQADGYIADGVHPRLINDGFRLASVEAKKALENLALKKDIDRTLLLQVARTSLRTKLDAELADKLTEAVVDAVLAIKQEGEEINLHMVEIMEMQHRSVIFLNLRIKLRIKFFKRVSTESLGIGHSTYQRSRPRPRSTSS